jgi:hypothetical protein
MWNLWNTTLSIENNELHELIQKYVIEKFGFGITRSYAYNISSNNGYTYKLEDIELIYV